MRYLKDECMGVLYHETTAEFLIYLIKHEHECFKWLKKRPIVVSAEKIKAIKFVSISMIFYHI
jgi:hypothetical protein